MKKPIALALVGMLILALGASFVSAAPPAGQPLHPYGQPFNLTEAQKQELAPLTSQMTDLHKQMLEVRKQIVQKQVAFGNLTQEQADQRIAWMQERMNARLQNGFAGGPGMGRGPGMMGPHHGRGPGCGQGPQWQQQQPAAK